MVQTNASGLAWTMDYGDDIDPPDESADAYYPVLNIDLRANNLAGSLNLPSSEDYSWMGT
jgi:hypothetical protein